MQRDGHSDDRTKAGASGRTPPVIEGAAVEVGVTPAATVEPVAEVDEPIVESAPEEAVETAEASAPPPPRKRSRAPRVIFTLLGLIIVAFAGAVAWLATPGYRAGDLKSKVIALLPPSAQQMLHLTSAPDAKTESAAKAPAATPSPAAPSSSSSSEAAKPDAAKPDAAKLDAAKPAVPKTEPERTAMGEPAKPAETTKPAETSKPAETTKPTVAAKPAESTDTGAASGQTPPAASTDAPKSGSMTVVGGPPVAIGVDPRRIEDMSVKIDGLQSKLDAALGRIGELQSKLDLAQGKLEMAQSKSDAAATADAVTQATQKIEALTQKLAAIEQKLEQPKTDTRAPQARENNVTTGREFAASRAVVAQATTEALRAGAPLADNLAALKGLGVADDKIADLSAFAKAGAPTATQLTAQWRGLRDKVVALDAPASGAGFGEKLIAKAKSVFHVTWAGQGAQNSIGATVARVDLALQRNDLAAAVAACDEFPAVAKNVVADWQTAATRRLKADAAARALLSESISAIGRSSSQ